MARSSARASGPETRKAGTGIPTFANFVNHDKIADSTTAARLQFLASRYGVIGGYASLIATMAWEASHAAR